MPGQLLLKLADGSVVPVSGRQGPPGPAGAAGSSAGLKLGSGKYGTLYPSSNNTSSTGSFVAGQIYATKFITVGSLQEFSFEVTTANASGTIRHCLYADLGDTPGALLSVSADLSCSTLGSKLWSGLNIAPGTYWHALHIIGSSTTLRTVTNANPYSPGMTSLVPLNFAQPGSITVAGVGTGASPNPFPLAGITQNASPAIIARGL